MNINDVPTIILVASGKGGVGKTTVATDIARTANHLGYTVGLVDADISTPNTPEVLGGEDVDTSDARLATHDSIVPPTTNGIQMVSQGIVLPDDVPVLRDGTWRAETVADYITSAEWDDDTDVVVIDTPPGTGEELQVIASEAPPNEAVVVTTPHPSSLRDATKSHEFFLQAEVPQRTVLNMTHIPGDDIEDHVTGEVESAPDYPLFNYSGEPDIPFETTVAAEVPYTPDFENRRETYTEMVEKLVASQEATA